MKHLKIYNYWGLNNQSEVFNYLVSTLKQTNATWDYFVNWPKVFTNIQEIEVDLNIMNYLIGKINFDAQAKFLFKKYPSIIKIIPLLIACREKQLEILTNYSDGKVCFELYKFSEGNLLADIDKVLEFMHSSGLAELFINKKIKNVVDYVMGIEVGLDSNGRKNRRGQIMENIVEATIAKLCKKNNYKYLKQASAPKIKSNFAEIVPVDKSSRRYDFAIHNGKSLYLIETNFYGGGGSKLKSTVGEYKNLQDYLRTGNHSFIWVTDGHGWETTLKPLEEAFYHIDFILNLNFLEKELLSFIIENNIK